MHVRHTAAGIEVLAPAKLNLFLEVLGARPDGFHEIETLMCPVSLYDTLAFRNSHDGEIRLRCETGFGASSPAAAHDTSPHDTLPRGTDNLVVRALMRLREAVGIGAGAAVRLVKRIPLASGLAGGSSDAAAALVAANEGWRLGLSRVELAKVAAELGSDVPFFLGRGAAICRGRGERIEPLAGLPALDFVVVRPPAGLSTADVYRACRAGDERRSVANSVEVLRAGRSAEFAAGLFNRLEAAAASLSPWIGRLRGLFAELDCLGHQMSGSGTSYFGICRNACHADRVKRRLHSRGVGQVFAVRGTW